MEEQVKPTDVVKKKRGNPNFQKGANNPYYKAEGQSMGENVEVKEAEKKPVEGKVEPVKTEPTKGAVKSDDIIGGGQKEIPNDVFSDIIPSQDVLPLDDEVKTKSYGTIVENTATASSNGSSIPPPPPVGGDSSATMGADQPLGQPTMAPPVQVLTPDEQRTQAEQTVQALLKIYDKAHGLGRWAAKVDNDKLLQLHTAGKIDLDMELPIGEKRVKVREFFAQYNAGIDEVIVVTDEFRQDITPPLVRIALKRGWLLSDEIYVGMLVAEDLATKVSMMVGLKKSANLVLEAVAEMKKNLANYGTTQAPMKKDKEVRQAEKAEREESETTQTTTEQFVQEHPTPNENDSWREPEAGV